MTASSMKLEVTPYMSDSREKCHVPHEKSMVSPMRLKKKFAPAMMRSAGAKMSSVRAHFCMPEVAIRRALAAKKDSNTNTGLSVHMQRTMTAQKYTKMTRGCFSAKRLCLTARDPYRYHRCNASVRCHHFSGERCRKNR